MDIKLYRYKNKLWRFAPDWLFKLFNKPIIFKDCKLSTVNLDGSIGSNEAIMMEITYQQHELEEFNNGEKNGRN